MSDDHVFEGHAIGGPFDGREIVNNTSKGFVLLDLETNKVVVYDYNSSDNTFRGRDKEDLNEEKLTKAQDDGGRSVRVLPTERD